MVAVTQSVTWVTRIRTVSRLVFTASHDAFFLLWKTSFHVRVSLVRDRAFLFRAAGASFLSLIYVVIEAHDFSFFALFLARIDLPFLRASADEDAPHFRNAKSLRVGFPLLSRSGPLEAPMRDRKDPRLGLSPRLTGGFILVPSLPFAFSPPVGDLPSLRVHAGVLDI